MQNYNVELLFVPKGKEKDDLYTSEPITIEDEAKDKLLEYIFEKKACINQLLEVDPHSVKKAQEILQQQSQIQVVFSLDQWFTCPNDHQETDELPDVWTFIISIIITKEILKKIKRAHLKNVIEIDDQELQFSTGYSPMETLKEKMKALGPEISFEVKK